MSNGKGGHISWLKNRVRRGQAFNWRQNNKTLQVRHGQILKTANNYLKCLLWLLGFDDIVYLVWLSRMLVILVDFPNHFRPVPSSRRACFAHFKSDFLSHGVLEDKSHHVRGFHYDLYPTNSQADFMHMSSCWMCFQSSSQASQMETEAMDVQQQDGGQDSPVHTTQPKATGKPFSEALSSQWHFSSSQWVRCDLFTSCFFTTSFDISSCSTTEMQPTCKMQRTQTTSQKTNVLHLPEPEEFQRRCDSDSESGWRW